MNFLPECVVEFCQYYVRICRKRLFRDMPQGAGICLGYAASSHLDLALSKLGTYVKQQVLKKDSSLFSGFFKVSHSYILQCLIRILTMLFLCIRPPQKFENSFILK